MTRAEATIQKAKTAGVFSYLALLGQQNYTPNHTKTRKSHNMLFGK